MTRVEENLEILKDIKDRKESLTIEEKYAMILADISVSLAEIADNLAKVKEDKDGKVGCNES